MNEIVYAFPKEQKEPIHDKHHVRNSIAHFSEVTGVTDSERDDAWQRIIIAARKYGVEVSATDWRKLPDGGKR